MNSKNVGNIGEAKTLAKFVELGIPVYIPFGDNEKADLVAEFNGKLNKIQCKTSVKLGRNNSIVVNAVSTYSNSHSTITTRYSQDDADYFSIYNVETDTLVLFPNNGKYRGKISIRVTPPLNNQRKDINFAEDFIFERMINT